MTFAFNSESVEWDLPAHSGLCRHGRGRAERSRRRAGVGVEERKVEPAQVWVFMTSKNNLKANYRFFSGSSKPGFRDSCHPEAVAACQGMGPSSLVLKDSHACLQCWDTGLQLLRLVLYGTATRIRKSMQTSTKHSLPSLMDEA